MKAGFVAVLMFVFAATASSRFMPPTDKNLVSTTIVINEVYGGAGCGTAGCSTYQNDFIELRNISVGLVNISGWSVQYASATGTSWQVTPIPANTLLRPGDTYLIAEAFGANGINPLPTPNTTGTIAMSSTAFKVALVNTTTPLSGACPVSASIVDLVGVGATASCFETAAAPSPSTTTSDARNLLGTDTDNNSLDFTAGAPTPQASLQPTAAGVGISGRVMSSDGRGLSRVTVTVEGGELSQPIVAITSPFGFYRFDGLTAGNSYVVTVSSKQYTFSMPTQVVTLGDGISELNFVAQQYVEKRAAYLGGFLLILTGDRI